MGLFDLDCWNILWYQNLTFMAFDAYERVFYFNLSTDVRVVFHC